MDDRLHTLAELASWWQRHLPVVRQPRTIRQVVHGLLEDAKALPHLRDAYGVSVKAITVFAQRHLEVVLLVAAIGEGLPDVVVDTGGAQHGTGHTNLDRFLIGQDADSGKALAPDWVRGQHRLKVVDPRRHDINEPL